MKANPNSRKTHAGSRNGSRGSRKDFSSGNRCGNRKPLSTSGAFFVVLGVPGVPGKNKKQIHYASACAFEVEKGLKRLQKRADHVTPRDLVYVYLFCGNSGNRVPKGEK